MHRFMAMADLRRIAACSEKIKDAYAQRDEAIIISSRHGETYRDIARYAGISHQRVAQIVAEARKE